MNNSDPNKFPNSARVISINPLKLRS